MASSLDQFIRFTTDSVGLERTIRLFNAISQILASFPFLLGLLVSVLNSATAKEHSPAATRLTILALTQRLSLARRFFRLFRWLESFNAAYRLYLAISPAPAATSKAPRQRDPTWVQTEQWLDVSARTFNGMYLLLETSNIVNVLRIDGLAIWSPEWERTLAVEAQRFWFFSLTCAVFSGLLKMLKVVAYTPIPPLTQGGASSGKSGGETHPLEKDKTVEEEEAVEGFDVKKEQERLRAIVRDRKRGRVLWRREVGAKMHGLGRSVAASALDTILPGTAVGWIKADPGTVGVAMLITTVLTGKDVWDRCGREVAEGK